MLILYGFKAGNLTSLLIIGAGEVMLWNNSLSLCLNCRLITVFFVFLADYRPIKCIHTTEDTGGVSRCVSVTEPKTSSHRVFGNQYRMGRAGGGWIIFCSGWRLVVNVLSCLKPKYILNGGVYQRIHSIRKSAIRHLLFLRHSLSAKQGYFFKLPTKCTHGCTQAILSCEKYESSTF